MTRRDDISGDRDSAALTCAHDYLLPALLKEMAQLRPTGTGGGRVFELGCGNGSVANVLAQHGWDVTGVDPSTEGIAQANAQYPALKLEEGSADHDLAARFGRFPVVNKSGGSGTRVLSASIRRHAVFSA